MNKAKEEALKMLKNNNAAKAAEILKKKSIETNAPSKNKSNFLEALDIRPLFSADAEKEAPPVAKLVAAILSLICGAAAAYLICGFFQERSPGLLSDKSDFVFGFVVPFKFILFCFCFGFVFDLKPQNLQDFEFPRTNFQADAFDERLRNLNNSVIFSPAYSSNPSNIHYYQTPPKF